MGPKAPLCLRIESWSTAKGNEIPSKGLSQCLQICGRLIYFSFLFKNLNFDQKVRFRYELK